MVTYDQALFLRFFFFFNLVILSRAEGCKERCRRSAYKPSSLVIFGTITSHFSFTVCSFLSSTRLTRLPLLLLVNSLPMKPAAQPSLLHQPCQRMGPRWRGLHPSPPPGRHLSQNIYRKRRLACGNPPRPLPHR